MNTEPGQATLNRSAGWEEARHCSVRTTALTRPQRRPRSDEEIFSWTLINARSKGEVVTRSPHQTYLASNMARFQRLVRFKDTKGSVYYGEAPNDRPLTRETLEGSSVPIYTGTLPWDNDFVLSSETKEVHEV